MSKPFYTSDKECNIKLLVTPAGDSFYGNYGLLHGSSTEFYI